MKKKVLIVDDSAFIRKILTDIINGDPMFEVIDTAQDPTIAADKIMKLHPDIITLDIEMPKMDGLTFLEKLMRLRPIPVLVISSLSTVNSEVAFEALKLGAIDYIAKPKEDIEKVLQSLADEVRTKLHACAKAQITPRKTHSQTKETHGLATDQVSALEKIASRKIGFQTTDKVIAIGASTGGTVALENLFKMLPVTVPGIVVVQHMPPGFTKPFADRLNGCCDLAISEATERETVISGRVLIAPGNRHIKLNRSGAKYFVNIVDTPHVNRHRPSVDVLFDSVAEIAGANGIGVILTGMGDDGARGLLNMKKSGAATLAQSEKSCIVFGMPKVAIEMGAADKIMSLEEIGQFLSMIKA